MNPTDDLEIKLREMPLQRLHPMQKTRVLEAAMVAAGKRRRSFSLAKMGTWFIALKLRYQVGFGALAAIWMLTLCLHFAEPKQEALAIAGFDHLPEVSARELMAALYFRNRILEGWDGDFSHRIGSEEKTENIFPRYRL